jgi:hypothetical protein
VLGDRGSDAAQVAVEQIFPVGHAIVGLVTVLWP